MALLTPMTLDEAKSIGRRFGLQITAFVAIERGSVNSNFVATLTDRSRVFFRVCEESDHAAVVAQNRLVGHLADHGVPTPVPMQLHQFEGSVATHAGKPVAVFRFCEGEMVCQKSVTDKHVQAVGEVLGRIHHAGQQYEGAPPNRFGFRALFDRLERLKKTVLSPELQQSIATLAQKTEELLAAESDKTNKMATTSLIHGDVFRDNVLWLNGKRLAAIIDFESASAGKVGFDLMVTLLAWCYDDAFNQSLATKLVNSYRTRFELTAADLQGLYDQARTAAVRFAITRITDFELRPRNLVCYKDFRRYEQRLAAIEAIGRKNFVAWLGF